jgi:hypothetical protein
VASMIAKTDGITFRIPDRTALILHREGAEAFIISKECVVNTRSLSVIQGTKRWTDVLHSWVKLPTSECYYSDRATEAGALLELFDFDERQAGAFIGALHNGEAINRDEGTELLCGLDGLLSFSGRLSLAEWKGTWLCSHADTLMWAVRLRVET